jgi:4-hydroxybenzoyl-CoA reductase subunit beta
VVRKPAECYATYAGDLAPVLAALDAEVAVVGPQGRRVFPLLALYTHDGQAPLALRRGEILREVRLPAPTGRAVYLKVRRRDAIDFPIISLAAALAQDRDGRVTHARVVFSGVGPGPMDARATVQALTGAVLTEALMTEVATRVVKELTPLRTSGTSPAYQRRLAGVLLSQALTTLRAGAV